MKQFRAPVLAFVVVAIVGSFLVFRGGGDQSSGSGQGRYGGQGSSGGSGKNGEFSQFQETHKFTFVLMKTASNLDRLERDGEAPLTQDQAKVILAALSPLSTQPTLSQDDAINAIKKIKGVLTNRQLTKMGKMKQPDRKSSSSSQDQGTRSQKPAMNFSAMQNFNPFSPQAGNPLSARFAKRMGPFLASLQEKAGGVQAQAPGLQPHQPGPGGHFHGGRPHGNQSPTGDAGPPQPTTP